MLLGLQETRIPVLLLRLFCTVLRLMYMFKGVRAHSLCASLLRTQFTCHFMHQAPVLLSNKMNNTSASGSNYGATAITFAWILILDVRWPLVFFPLITFSTVFLSFVKKKKNGKRLQIRRFSLDRSLGCLRRNRAGHGIQHHGHLHPDEACCINKAVDE